MAVVTSGDGKASATVTIVKRTWGGSVWSYYVIMVSNFAVTSAPGTKTQIELNGRSVYS